MVRRVRGAVLFLLLRRASRSSLLLAQTLIPEALRFDGQEVHDHRRGSHSSNVMGRQPAGRPIASAPRRPSSNATRGPSECRPDVGTGPLLARRVATRPLRRCEARSAQPELQQLHWPDHPALLERGLVSPGKPAQWMRLANRLRAHEAVSILSIGSSLVATAAGCNMPLPVLSGCECPQCCGTFCGAVCRSLHEGPCTCDS